MEMSGFARLDKSIPVVADIGVAWPIIALRLEQELGVSLEITEGVSKGADIYDYNCDNKADCYNFGRSYVYRNEKGHETNFENADQNLEDIPGIVGRHIEFERELNQWLGK